MTGSDDMTTAEEEDIDLQDDRKLLSKLFQIGFNLISIIILICFRF